MKKLLLLFLVLSSCAVVKQPAYILLGQSNACVELAAAMQDNTIIKILQINHGGQPIEEWWTETAHTKAGQDLSYIAAQKNYYITAVFWFQGEQNCYEVNTQDHYYEYTSNWFNNLISYCGNIDINIFQIYYSGTSEEVLGNIDFIRNEQQRLNSQYSGTIIDTQKYERKDAWHLSSDSYNELGRDIILLYEEQP